MRLRFVACLLCIACSETRAPPQARSVARTEQALLPVDAEADLFLGQMLGSLSSPNLVDARGLYYPQGVVVDSSSAPPRVYVADTNNHRVLGWSNASAFASGAPAALVFGQPDFYVTSCGVSATALCLPTRLAVDTSGNLFVADTNNNRVVEFNSPFAAGDTTADRVFGQPNMTSNQCNRGTTPGPLTLCRPDGVGVDASGNLFVSDNSNHRVLQYAGALASDAIADVVLGQSDMSNNGVNRIDTRGLANPWGLAVDRSSTPNRLYVADSGNHRVLGWPNAQAFLSGAAATLVIGQPSGSSATCNAGGRGASSLCNPAGLAVDGAGVLYVADANNHRVLAFNNPFTTDVVADKVWGQSNFTLGNCAISSQGLCTPTGVALRSTGDLVVADASNNRVVRFSGGFAGDTIADGVYGQADLVSRGSGVSQTQLYYPQGVAVDTANNIYVADSYNYRAVVFKAAPDDGIADVLLGQLSWNARINSSPGPQSLYQPTSVTVDASNRVWIVDYWTRVLGFTDPVATDTVPDWVIGQPTFSSSGSCGSSPGPSCFSNNALAVTADAAGTVFVADRSGNRVLRFDAPTTTDRIADAVLGQLTFTGVGPNFPDLAGLSSPRGLSIDRSSSPNRLYVADTSNSRVLSWPTTSLATGQAATRFFGQSAETQTGCNTGGRSASSLCNPLDVSVDPAGNLYVADHSNLRVLEYDGPAAGDSVADRVFGQSSMTNASWGRTALGMSYPSAVATGANGLWVADLHHHRVLEYLSPLTTDSAADAVLGQALFTTGQVNFTDARSLYYPWGVAVDTSVSPNRLYVADPNNNRVLGWSDVSLFSDGLAADLVIGQPDFYSYDCAPNVTASSLCTPTGLAVDTQGRLVVADQGRSRVLIFDSPFTTDTAADEVLGQPDLYTSEYCPYPSATSMCDPYGVATDEADNVWVVDYSYNRVLGFQSPRTTDTVADVVVGEADFTDTSCSTGLCNPMSVAVDKSVTPSRIYVAWGYYNMVKGYDAPFTTDTAEDLTLGTGSCTQGTSDLCGVYGVAVDGEGNVYASEYDNSRVSQFISPATTDTVADQTFGSSSGYCNGDTGGVNSSSLCYPHQVAVDAVGSLYVVDSNNNRIAIYLANGRPLASSLSVTPAAPRTNDVLVGAYTFSDAETAPEGTTQVRWYRNGALVPSLNDLRQVPASATTRDQQWYFTVHPHDGIEFGRLVTSPTITILNTAPTAAGPLLTPATPVRGSQLTGAYAYADDDSDGELSSEIRWYMNNVEQTGLLNQRNVPGASVSKGQLWYFTVKPKDGTTFGTLITSPVVQVQNTAPMASAAQIAPTSPVAASSLTASYVYGDVDSDPQVGTLVRWYKNGALQSSLNGLVVIGPLTSNDTWYFTVQPADGSVFGPLVTSTSVVVGSSAPTASNVAVTPAVPTQPSTLTANYSYTSPDLQAEGNSSFAWYRNGTVQPAYANLRTVPGPLTRGDRWRFTVTPCDNRVTALCGPLQTSADVVVANTPPVATSPAVAPAAPRHLDSLDATYAYADIDGDSEAGSQLRWFRNGVEQPALANLHTLPGGTASRGEVWHFSVSPGDGSALGTAVLAPVLTIRNTAPVASALVLAPAPPRVTDALKATWAYADDDGDTASGSEVRWFRNGVEDDSLFQASSVPQAKLVKGAQWFFTVRPKDGSDFGATVTSATVTIANSPPSVSGLFISPTVPLVGQSLSVNYSYADADGDAESGTTISWLRNGMVMPTLANLLQVPAGVTAKSDRWSFTIRPSDGSTPGAPVTSPEVTIANSPPTVSGVAIAPAQPTTEDNLVVSYIYTDPDADSESGTEIRWSRNSTLLPQYDGSKTLPSSATTKGEVWQASVRPKDGFDLGAVVTSPPVTIFNAPPTASSVTLTPASPKVTDSIVASYAYLDADTDPQQGSELRWYRNGVEVTTLFNQTVVAPGVALAGETWYLTVRPRDGVDFGPVATSGSVIVGSSAPVATSLAILPATPRTADVLTASYLYSSPDLKAESGTLFHWFKDGVEVVALANASTVPAAQTSRGESWTFTVQPGDGSVFGAVQTSPAVVIGNTAPLVSAVVVTPPQPQGVDTLSTSYTFTDADSDSERDSEVHWYRNGIEQFALAGSATVPPGTTAKREVWYYLLRPKDGIDFGTAAVSAPTFILNSAPVANAGLDQTISPTAALTPVTLDGSGSTDVDRDVLTYVWMEGTTVLGQLMSPVVQLPVGQHTITLRVNDGDTLPDAGVSASSDTVVINIADPALMATVPADFSAPPGVVELVGTGADSIGRTLSYQWQQTTGDPVPLLSASTPTTSFFALPSGARTFQFLVSAGSSTSPPKSVVVRTLNVGPWAIPPPRQVVAVGAERILDGSHSDDPNADALTFTWAVQSGPATLINPSNASARATAATDGRSVIGLTVGDGALEHRAEVELLAVDRALAHAPVAQAGPDGVGELGATLPLNAEASYDLDGDRLSYAWRVLSGPQLTLSSPTSRVPVFKASAPGTAVFGLIVSDGTLASEEDTVSYDLIDPALNHRPLVRTGGDSTGVVASTVTLDASRSLDPDGDALTWAWRQTGGVTVTLSSATAAAPTFTALRPGMLTFSVVVSDGRAVSAPALVHVQVTPATAHAPVADAGVDARVLLGTDVQLDGSGSTDADGDVLHFVWEQVLGPPVPLDGADPSPRFTPPNQGRYRFRLVVWDEFTPSFPAEVEVLVSTHGLDNAPPVAVVGKDQEVEVGALTRLDGTGSSDPDPADRLTYQWDLVAFPTGAEVTLEGSTSATPQFTPPVAGPYQLRLVVSDGDLFSPPAYVSVLAGKWAKGGGCGCTSGGEGLPMLTAVLGLLFCARRRRGAALGVALALAAFSAPPALAGKPAAKQSVKASPRPPRGKAKPPAATAGAGEADATSAGPDGAPFADTAQGHFEQAKRLYLDFQLDGVVPRLEFALASKGATLELKLEIYKLMAMTWLALDNGPPAEEALLKLLELKPDYELTGGGSPKVRTAFTGAQKAFRLRQAVKLEHQPPVAAAGHLSTTVDVRAVAGLERVASITLHYRIQGSESYSQLPMATAGSSGDYSATVPNLFPGAAGGVSTVEYFIRARDAKGAALADVGSELTPLQMKVETVAAGAPIYKSPWFWTGVGVAVAGGVATAFLLRQDARAPVGTLGVEKLR